MTRVGLVGAGALGRYHAVRWRMLGARVDAVHDTVPAAAERVAAEFGATVCATLDELIARVDLVDVCTPPTSHRAPTAMALAAGRPVVLEKPLARTFEDGAALVRASDRTGTPLFVAHVVRFWPEFARLRQLVSEGTIGRPGVYRSSRVGSFPQWGDWFADEAVSGGVLLDVMIHDFDYARWLMGEIERIFVRRARWDGPPRGEHALALVRFAGGAIGHIEGGWSRPIGMFGTTVEVAGDGGLLEADSRASQAVHVHLHSGETVRPQAVLPDDPYLAELRHVLDCLAAGEPFLVTPRDALAALRVSLAGIESAATGRVVTLAPLEEGL